MFGKILVAVGGDDASLEPARVGGRLAGLLRAQLTLLSVKRSTAEALGEPYYSERQSGRLGEAQSILEQARRAAVEAGALHAEIEWVEGNAAERIVEVANHGHYELIVMGNRRRGRLQTAILGSVSAAVAAHSGVPVVIVPEKRPPRGEATTQPE
jgi:nucleotide-binding universal stress UspA family protein